MKFLILSQKFSTNWQKVYLFLELVTFVKSFGSELVNARILYHHRSVWQINPYTSQRQKSTVNEIETAFDVLFDCSKNLSLNLPSFRYNLDESKLFECLSNCLLDGEFKHLVVVITVLLIKNRELRG